MKLSGIIKTTLIDYPGYIATTLFTQGCNFKCPYCHNPKLIPPESDDGKYLEQEYLWHFLQERKKFLDGVVITGGEPTLQPDLENFLSKLKDMDYKVKLDTNGSQPEVLKTLLNKKLVDYVALDVKGSKKSYSCFSNEGQIMENLKESMELLRKADIDCELRTTVVPGIHDLNEMKQIGELIKGFSHYTIQNFRPDVTYNQEYEQITPFSDKQLKEFKELLENYINTVEIKN